jgi:hypothetical protein
MFLQALVSGLYDECRKFTTYSNSLLLLTLESFLGYRASQLLGTKANTDGKETSLRQVSV